MAHEPTFTSPAEAAYDHRILIFGRLLAAAKGFEYLLSQELEDSTGLSHSLFEMLLIVARAGEDGVSVKDIAQAKVVTSGGATRLVSRAVEQGLVDRRASTVDGRVQLVRLTPAGTRVLLEASAIHARNIERQLLSALPPGSEKSFEAGVRALSKSVSATLPVMP
ncbi:MarR family transcriptional regulator [Microbacterium sp. PM5]|uniref:MarR family winged helix-turn-helix transcriptional regulator n=1 Tax=Microbacterium sp. PM5 TaxID=2014534 RepID=UPI000DD11AF4|nr:MarR family transcriptional regulator [Microbacterium sp. PM5]AXA95244.1 MarR family transcriptional regulator [Microbacterium sp. PM5]